VDGENYVMWNFMICTLHQMLRSSNQEGNGRLDMQNIYGRSEKCIENFILRT
jgi:hypothetical protein